MRQIFLTIKGGVLTSSLGATISKDASPSLYYGERVLLCCSFLDKDNNPLVFNQSDVFEFLMNKDYSHSTSYMIYSNKVNEENDWSEMDKSKGKICFRINTNTNQFKEQLGTSQSIFAISEIQKFSLGNKSILLQNQIKCNNVIKSITGAPIPTDPEYLNEVENDSKYQLIGNLNYNSMNDVDVNTGSFTKTTLCHRLTLTHNVDLTTINGGVNGDSLIIKTEETGFLITIKNTDNINCNIEDYPLPVNQSFMLIKQYNKWEFIGELVPSLAGYYLKEETNTKFVSKLSNQYLPITSKTILAGILSVDQSNHSIICETGTSDELETITGMEDDSRCELRLETNTDEVIIKHNVGNILCPNNEDITFKNNQILIAHYTDTKVKISGVMKHSYNKDETYNKNEVYNRTEIDAIQAGINRRAAVLSIVDATLTPGTENDGDRFILNGTPHVNWDGAADKDIVEFNSSLGLWVATTPTEGFITTVKDQNMDAQFLGTTGSEIWELKDVTHSNREELETIDQHLSSADNVSFVEVSMNNMSSAKRKLSYMEKSADYNLTEGDSFNYLDVTTTNTDKTMFLPMPSLNDRRLIQIEKIDADVGKVIVKATRNISITEFADNSGNITVTSVGHNMLNGDEVTITSTQYNNTYTIFSETDDTFDITETFTSNDTGAATINYKIDGQDEIELTSQYDKVLIQSVLTGWRKR